MAKLNAKTLAAVTLAAVTLTAPAIAQANDGFNNSNYSYEDCKRVDGDNQLVGGLIGAVAGGVFGSQVAGNGARTEGSALGALLGAGLGAAIGDDRNKCSSLKPRNTAYSNGYNNSGYQTINRGISNSGLSSRTVYTSPRVQTVGYNQARTYNIYEEKLNRIDYKIDRLKAERHELKNRRSYGHDRYVANRLYDISCRLDELKKKKKLIKRDLRNSQRGQSRNDTYYRGY